MITFQRFFCIQKLRFDHQRFRCWILCPNSHRQSSNNAKSSLKKTALYQFHLDHGAKMVPFAGYSMPVLYSDLSIKDSHLHTRSSASLFDVSHMLQMEIEGEDRIRFFESLVVADVKNLPENGATLTLYTNESGGIIDDLIVSKKSNSLYVVSNASRSDADLEHLNREKSLFLQKNSNAKLEFNILRDSSLLAFQGPKTAQILQTMLKENLMELKFMNAIETSLDGIPVRLTRCGYTGEDGFEIKVHNDQAALLAQKLLENESVKLAGLGARDSLRLEAGLCLYGNDIDMKTTPIQAVLAWTIAKRRRSEANFLGADIILKELKEKPKIKRIGLIGIESGPPARSGSKIYSEPKVDSNSLIGQITSGVPSPSLERNIAMAYVPSEFSKIETPLFCEIRGKLFEYQVTKMPFVKANYFM
ncbi:hypothetical protein NH340_JMT06440 [Sarcoptes scabiei]|nr:hypothetical protein NH340_JMT06440 [Sarcoptes scabiei]